MHLRASLATRYSSLTTTVIFTGFIYLTLVNKRFQRMPV